MPPDFTLPGGVLSVLRRLEQAGFEAYLAGGAVRDLLLYRTPSDYDIATEARPFQVKALFSRTLPTGEPYGTVTVFYAGGQTEVTTFRTEGAYRDGRRPSRVSFAGGVEQDLGRRDFTVNAMAWNPHRGLVDPYNGREDLARRVIRAVGNPGERFREDALRILRAYRFSAQLGFALEPATRAAAADCAGLTRALSAERVFGELNRILLSPRPSAVFELMALGVPEVLAGFFPKERGALGRVPAEPVSRWAALFADTGADPETVLPALRADNRTRREAALLLRLLGEGPPRERAQLKRCLRDYGPASVKRALPFWEGEDRARARELLGAVLASGEPYRPEMLALRGEDLRRAGLPPGPVYREILSFLLGRAIEEPALNEKRTLLALALNRFSGGKPGASG